MNKKIPKYLLVYPILIAIGSMLLGFAHPLTGMIANLASIYLFLVYVLLREGNDSWKH